MMYHDNDTTRQARAESKQWRIRLSEAKRDSAFVPAPVKALSFKRNGVSITREQFRSGFMPVA